MQSRSKLPRGLLIVIEGIDRCGKSTQSEKLARNLSEMGMKVTTMEFPKRDTPSGKSITRFLQGQIKMSDVDIHNMFSLNRWQERDSMDSTLRNGTTIICSRYAYSGAAYSMAKGLNMITCKASDSGLIAPDILIYLDADPEVASKRKDYGKEIYEKIDFQKKVSECFQKLISFEKKKSPSILEVDRKASIEETEKIVCSHCVEFIKSCKIEKKFNLLWVHSN